MRFFFCFFQLCVLSIHAQINLKGKLIDQEKNETIPFATVGSLRTNMTVLSDENGLFNLALSKLINNDTIKFYAIGYKELSIPIHQLRRDGVNEIKLEGDTLNLDEIEINADKLYPKKLGVLHYDKQNCSGFIGRENNWRGVETAIRIKNNDHKLLRVKDFSFYIIKNNISDSLTFRLNFYSSNKYYPTKNILRRSIIFKTNIKQGEVTLDLSNYDIRTYSDFYVSLECLMEKVNITDFCFAGETKEPSFVRESAFYRWKKIRGGGAAFNVTVLYSKKN